MARICSKLCPGRLKCFPVGYIYLFLYIYLSVYLSIYQCINLDLVLNCCLRWLVSVSPCLPLSPPVTWEKELPPAVNQRNHLILISINLSPQSSLSNPSRLGLAGQTLLFLYSNTSQILFFYFYHILQFLRNFNGCINELVLVYREITPKIRSPCNK